MQLKTLRCRRHGASRGGSRQEHAGASRLEYLAKIAGPGGCGLPTVQAAQRRNGRRLLAKEVFQQASGAIQKQAWDLCVPTVQDLVVHSSLSSTQSLSGKLNSDAYVEKHTCASPGTGRCGAAALTSTSWATAPGPRWRPSRTSSTARCTGCTALSPARSPCAPSPARSPGAPVTCAQFSIRGDCCRKFHPTCTRHLRTRFNQRRLLQEVPSCMHASPAHILHSTIVVRWRLSLGRSHEYASLLHLRHGALADGGGGVKSPSHCHASRRAQRLQRFLRKENLHRGVLAALGRDDAPG